MNPSVPSVNESSAASSPAVRVSDLSKVFESHERREGLWGGVRDLVHRRNKTVTAVGGISFEVPKGEIVGFIGPNGAGKSTTIKMLTGILKPSSGEMQCLGRDPYRERKVYCSKIGVVFGQRTQLWWDIAVIESFNLLAAIYKVPRAEYLQRLELLTGVLELGEFLRTPVRKLSLGQRLRSDLAASLLHGPELLFLDEPTIGVDAVAKTSIRAFLKTINREFNTTVILTTHDLVEIEELCERIIIIDHGRIIFDGSIDTVRALPGVKRTVSVQFQGEVSPAALSARIPMAEFKPEGGRVLAEYDPQKIPTIELVRAIVNSFPVADLSTIDPAIEDILIRIYRQGMPVSS